MIRAYVIFATVVTLALGYANLRGIDLIDAASNPESIWSPEGKQHDEASGYRSPGRIGGFYYGSYHK